MCSLVVVVVLHHQSGHVLYMAGMARNTERAHVRPAQARRNTDGAHYGLLTTHWHKVQQLLDSEDSWTQMADD